MAIFVYCNANNSPIFPIRFREVLKIARRHNSPIFCVIVNICFVDNGFSYSMQSILFFCEFL